MTAAFVGCGPKSEQTGEAEDTLYSGTSEEEAPLVIDLRIPKQKLSVGGKYPVRLTWSSGQDVSRAVGKMESSGVIALSNVSDLTWDDVVGNYEEELEGRGEFHITGTGLGQLSVRISGLDASGDILWGPREAIYFLATKNGVYTNTYSSLLLELDHLQRLRDSGSITRREYKERRDSILNRGTKVEVEIDSSG